MKIKKRSLVILSVLALLCVMPLLFAAGGGDATAEPGDETSSYVKFIETITMQKEGDSADFFLFLGRFHPLVLHLPIGMVVIAFFLQAFAIWKKKDDLDFAYAFILGFGFITACVAVMFGSFLALSGGYNTELLDRHGWGGLLFAIMVGVSFLLIVKFIKSGGAKAGLKKGSIGVLGAALGVMSFVGHDGGSLTHGEEYLFKYAPNWVRNLTGRPDKVIPGQINPDGTVYEQLVAPFLEKHCYECHGSSKKKGKLRLDTIDFIKEGGKTDDPPLIAHGNAEGSNLYKLMVIDDEDEIMPPDGMLPKDHTDFIKWWIDTAKDDKDLFEKKVKDANVPEKFMNINKSGAKAKEVHKGANEEAKAEPTEKVEEQVAEVKEKTEEAVTEVKEKAEDVVKAVGDRIDFAKVIAPIFEARCIKCHGKEKQKGEYRMDKAEFIMVAGDSEEKPIVAGKPAESYLVKLIKMDEDADDVMPPKGGTLTPEQIAAIEKWIELGAKFPADLQLEDKSPKK